MFAPIDGDGAGSGAALGAGFCAGAGCDLGCSTFGWGWVLLVVLAVFDALCLLDDVWVDWLVGWCVIWATWVWFNPVSTACFSSFAFFSDSSFSLRSAAILVSISFLT